MSKSRTDSIIKKILVAVDGSKPSTDAAVEAIDLAEKYSADVIALYVIPSDLRYGYAGDVIAPELGTLKEVVSIATEKGQKYVDDVKQKASDTTVNIQTEVLIGVNTVVKEIVKYAEKQKVDLIVIGTRGMSGIKRMLLRSTASGVVTYSHCPVMVVK